MPTTRRRRPHAVVADRITPEVVEAWQSGDAVTLNRLLQIMPHQFEPWPPEVSALGVDPDGPNHRGHNPLYGWQRAVDLQRALLAICPPGRVGRHGEPLGPA